MSRPGAFRLWIRAARPHTLPAGAAPVLAGAGLAAARGVFRPGPFAAALAGALLLQLASNLANDYYDHVHGVDTGEREGFARVTGSGAVDPERVRRWMWSVLAAALAPGAYLVWVGGWAILALGLAAMLAAVTYTGGPWPYGHRGLGDPAVFLFFGLAAVAGTYYVQAGRWSLESVWLGAGPGALATAILAVNNLRDIETDARAGKRTLAVMLGPARTRAEYLLLCGLAAVVPPAGVALLGWTPWSLISLAGLLLLARPLRTVLGGAAGQEDADRLDPALVDTARSLGAYGALAGLGFLL